MVKYDLCILIPTFHEEKNIKSLFTEFNKLKSNLKLFYCFVDDSTNDLTKKEIEFHFKNKNFKILKFLKTKEISTRCKSSWNGFKWIINNLNSDYVVEMDADLAQHPKDLLRGYDIICNENSDVLIFSKYHKKSLIEGRDFLRSTISYLYTFSCKIMFSYKITDYSNSYRIYSFQGVINLLNIKRRFDSPIQHLENILFFVKNNYEISETYCHYVERSDKNSSIKPKHLLVYAKEFLLCLKVNLFKS